MSAKITISFLYQYYEEEDKIAFQFLLDDIIERQNYTEVKYFIHKYDVIAGIITNIKFTKSRAGQTVILQEKIKIAENYHYNLLLAKREWVYFFNSYAANEKATVNLVFTYWHSCGPALKNRKTKIIQSSIGFTTQLKMIGDNIEEYAKNNEKRKKADDSDLGLIPNFVLADAIAEGFNHRKIDILFLCNCYVQTFENGFVFSDAVQYLAGSESTISNIGPNLKSLFNLIERMIPAQSPINIDALAEDIVLNYKNKFSETRVLNYFKSKSPGEEIENIKYNLTLQSVCINRMDLYSFIFTFLNDAAKKIGNDKNLLSIIEQVRDNETTIPCRDVSLINKYRTGYIDGFNFLELLAALSIIPSINITTIKILTEPVIYSDFPNSFFQNAIDKNYEIKPHGIAIYFPSNKKFNTKNERKYSVEQFFYKLIFDSKVPLLSEKVMASEWLTFLNNYYENI